MQARRLSKCVDIVRLWPFFVEGFQFVGRYRKYSLGVEDYRKSLFLMVKTPSAWIGVTENDEAEPVAFWCAHEVTPAYSKEREFEVFLRYHKTHQRDATLAVQQLFDLWCEQESIKRYFVSTRRDDSSGPRRFPADEYGLKKAYTVYKKEL